MCNNLDWSDSFKFSKALHQKCRLLGPTPDRPPETESIFSDSLSDWSVRSVSDVAVMQPDRAYQSFFFLLIEI